MAEHAAGDALYERIASEHLRIREENSRHRCRMCWHDTRACICAHLPALTLHVKVRLLVLMHQKEYLGAGDNAKLLIAMLPADQARLFVYGRSDDWAAFAAELADDPPHAMLLWPGDGALTLGQFLEALPESSGWRRSRAPATPDAPLDAAAALGGLRLSGPPASAAAQPSTPEATHAQYCGLRLRARVSEPDGDGSPPARAAVGPHSRCHRFRRAAMRPRGRRYTRG